MRRRGAKAPALQQEREPDDRDRRNDDQRQPFYRIDRFVVPDAARAEFIGRVRMTHAVLRQQPGFVRDALLEHPGEPGHRSS